MTNYFFNEEEIKEDDLFFICYMVERVARVLHQRNRYVVNQLGYEELIKKLSLASVLHCENPVKVVNDWILEYQLLSGDYYFDKVNKEIVKRIPTELQMGKVYKRLILQTLKDEEDYAKGMLRVYNSNITQIIDDYNTGAFYEPSYVIKRAYYAGSFN